MSSAKPPSAYYERHLPHWQPEHKALFITWRLHGSLPGGWTGSYLDTEKQRSEKSAKISPGRQFRIADSRLDAATSGPLWLKDPRVAKCVEQSFLFAESDLQLYRLHAWVVMANHVHLLIHPAAPLRRITKTLKGFTARKANVLLGRTGRPFWQDESFDHWVRDEAEFARVVSYIERNPVTAGLVRDSKDWPWSSAHR